MRRYLLGVSVLLSLLPTVLPAGAAVRLEQSEGKTYLVRGTQRLLVQGPGASPPWEAQPEAVRLPGGYQVTTAGDRSELVISGPGQAARTVPAAPLLEQWPQEDSLWGGHEAANDLRYLLRAGTDGTDAFTDLTAAGPTALAVLNWHGSGSGGPIAAQYLVRIDPVGAAVAPVRQLAVPPASGTVYGYSHPPLPRLFRWREHLLLYSQPQGWDPYAPSPNPPSTLSRIDGEGNPHEVQARFPAQLVPVRMLDGRWLVLATAGPPAYLPPLWALDLQSGKLSKIAVSAQFSSLRVRLPAHGRRFLVMGPGTTTTAATRAFVVTLPGGRAVPLAPLGGGSVVGGMWGDLAIMLDQADDRRVYRIYDAKSGRLLQRVKQP